MVQVILELLTTIYILSFSYNLVCNIIEETLIVRVMQICTQRIEVTLSMAIKQGASAYGYLLIKIVSNCDMKHTRATRNC